MLLLDSIWALKDAGPGALEMIGLLALLGFVHFESKAINVGYLMVMLLLDFKVSPNLLTILLSREKKWGGMVSLKLILVLLEWIKMDEYLSRILHSRPGVCLKNFILCHFPLMR